MTHPVANHGPDGTVSPEPRRQALVLLANRAKASLLAGLLESNGMDVHIAGTSDEFWSLYQTRLVELMVVEHELAGFLSGAELLERVGRRVIRPAAVLVARPSALVRSLVRRLGIQWASDASPERVAATACRALESWRGRTLQLAAPARSLVDQGADVPPMPALRNVVSTQLQQPEIDVGELVDRIALDPRTTAELVRIAYDAVGRFKDLAGALEEAGVAAVARFLASKKEESRSWPSFRARLHRRAVTIASVAASLASRLDGFSPDSAYVLGLLQDVGMFVLLDAHGQRYIDLTQRARQAGQVPLALLERQELGASHADVSAALLLRWGLPVSMASLVHGHHDVVANDQRPQADRDYIRLLRAAERAADLLDGGLGTAAVARRIQRNEAFLASCPLETILTALEGGLAERDRVELAAARSASGPVCPPGEESGPSEIVQPRTRRLRPRSQPTCPTAAHWLRFHRWLPFSIRLS